MTHQRQKILLYMGVGREVAELNISNGPDKPQEDFLTQKRQKILLYTGAWEGSCGT